MNCFDLHKTARKYLLPDTTNNPSTNRIAFVRLHQMCCDSLLHALHFLHAKKAKRKQNTNAELRGQECLSIFVHSISYQQDKCGEDLQDPFSLKEYLFSQALHTAAQFFLANI